MLTWEEWKVGAEDDQHDVDWEYMFGFCDSDNSFDITQDELLACQGTIQSFNDLWYSMGGYESRGGNEINIDEAIANVTDSTVDVYGFFQTYDTNVDDVVTWYEYCEIAMAGYTNYC